MKLIAILTFSFALSCPIFASDVGTAFMPTGQSPIKMKGSVEGDELTCKDSKKQDCQDIFDKVFDILDRADYDELDRGKAIKGYIKYKGKKRKNMEFTSIVKEFNGSEARMICEYDAKNDEAKVNGLRWVDPSAR